jgi:hypothetical protein
MSAYTAASPLVRSRRRGPADCSAASEQEIIGDGKSMRSTNFVLVPIWFIGLCTPFVIAGIVAPVSHASTATKTMPGTVLYVYIACVGQCYRLAAGGLNMYAYFMQKPLLPELIMGKQPTPDKDVVLPFFLDFCVGFSSIIIAATFAPHPLLWGALIFWVGYGWMDHCFAGYRLMLCKRFGPYPRFFLNELGFEIFVATSVAWQASNLAMLLVNKDVHTYFGIIY